MHSLDELVTNLRNIALKCCSFGAKNVYISGTVINNKYQTLFFKVLTQKLVGCVTGVLVDLLTICPLWDMENVIWLKTLFII